MIEKKPIEYICLWLRSLKKYYEKLFLVDCFPRDGNIKTLIVKSSSVHFFISENNDNVNFK